MEIFSNGRLVLGAALLATVVGCSQDARLSSALLVNVTVDSSSKAQCIRVLVRPGSGGEQATDGIAVKDELRVAVYRGEGWSTDVSVLARGYDDCSKPVNQFIEETALKNVNFPGSGTELVSLVLKGAEDVDHDGFSSPQDCDDNDATVHPGANELCTDTVDKNCSGTTGCADLACVGPCGANGEGACVQGVCKATTEVSCTDGQDNDSDFLIDCQDPDCQGQRCDDKSACTTGETCQSNGQCAAPTGNVACNTPPGQCYETTGSCNPLDAGCTYTLTTGSCDDGNPCTTGETCQSDGSCGAPTGGVTCNTPPGQCFETAGVCNPQDGGCTYTLTTGSCDDQSACTTGETCNSVGACVPTFTEQCANPPGQCYQSAGASSCDPVDGGCNYTVRTGSCDDNNPCTVGETCQTNGTCGAPTSNVSCTTPPNSQCYAPAGVCNTQDGGCNYTLLLGAGCDDGNACTHGETCQADGTCGPPTTTTQCNTPPPGQCYQATGSCNPLDGTCSYGFRGGACDDGNACTTGESCQTDGTCGAPTSAVTCTTPPGQCFATSGTCNPTDGACSYGVKTGDSCDDQSACTTGERCLDDGGCGAPTSTVTCTTPPGQCFADAGTCDPSNGACNYAVNTGDSCNDQSACTTGESCLDDGGCGAPTSTVTCTTPPGQCFADAGTCDPSNGVCSYPVTTGDSCNDQTACTTGESCLDDGGCGAPTSTVTCTTPPGQCFASAGNCDPSNGSCSYDVVSGSCNDGNACTTGDSCLNDGGCAGPTPVICSAANPCFDAGVCDPGTGCPTPQPMVGAACDDSNTCTLGESCDSSGNCGTPVSTTTCNPNQCQSSGSCLSDAGCSFTPKSNGSACTGGTCVNGSCLLLTGFTYTPSNFTPDQSKVLGSLTINCPLTFNTDGANPTFTTCSGTGESITPQVITQKSSTLEAVVLHVSALSVTNAGSLTVTGARPLIIAVYGQADIAGTLDVSATTSTSGAGANSTCSTSGGANGVMSGPNGGSGAGGAGNAGNGGNGGQGTNNSAVGSGGAPTNNSALTPLAGGCRGGNGGSLASTGPNGGGGGGAIQVSASGSLRVSGSIFASGGGGRGGTAANGQGEGGGGGGSAGSILLEGATMSLQGTSKITANGGQGGEGAGSATTGANGTDGVKGSSTAVSNAGVTPRGGDGGGGAAGNTLNGSVGGNGNTGGGGGGGGGAVGRIRLNSSAPICRVNVAGQVISPSNNNAVNATSFTSNTTITNSATCP